MVCRFLLPLEMDHPGVVLVTGELGGTSGSLVRSVNDIPLVSMPKDDDGSAVWSNGSRNKYDPS